MLTMRTCGWAVILGLLAGTAHAAVVQSTSCSSADVQSAINTAASGDTVALPNPCSATWSATVTIPNTKGIILDGTRTTITRGSLSGSTPIVQVNASTTISTRVMGFAFVSDSGLVIKVNGGDGKAPYRLDHMAFTGAASVRVEVWAPGLIDHNSFTWTATNGGEMIHNMGYGASSTTGWAIDVTPGGPDAVYVEDNTFTNQISGNPAYFWGGSALQAYYGARTVFRYNTLNNCQIDQHGTAGMIGARWWEIYENTFNVTDPNAAQSDYIVLRGGSGVVFNNHKVGYANGGAGRIHIYEEDSGYPALYQVGRGKDQVLDPAYIWGNDANDSTMQVVDDPGQIEAGRDYYSSPKPGYTPHTYPNPIGGATPPRPPTGVTVVP